jgi:cation:H+ antiporter
VKTGYVVWLGATLGAGIPTIALRFSGIHIDPSAQAIIYAIGIVSGAFLLSWAAEVAQMDVSASLAIALLALIAILPEYAIEAVLAWKAGASFDIITREVTPEMARVAANVTGANRLLVGLGWSLVILIYWFKARQPMDLRGHMRLELVMLVIATLLSYLIFFTGQVHMLLAAVLIGIYLFYLWSSSRQESEEPDLVGVSVLIGSLPALQRRLTVVSLFFYSAAVILIAAEPFVEALVETGLELGIDEFILIQWIAPLASESPEIIVAVLFSLRSNPIAGLSTLISSEVNQLTVLIGSMVVVFSLSAGEPLNFLLDSRQSVEFLLTSCVSLFAILLIAPRLISWRSGLALLSLFIAHLFFVEEGARMIWAFAYLGLALGLIAFDRQRVKKIFNTGTD